MAKIFIALVSLVAFWTSDFFRLVSGQFYRANHQVADCDFRFVSSERKNGTFSSPSFPNPYPVDVTCRYSFQGQGAERVQLMFIDFELLHQLDVLEDSEVGCEEADSVAVSVYIGGLPTDLWVFCGRKRPPMLMSHNAQMEVTFTSRSLRQGRGFVANYSFITDFGIKSGQRNTSMACGFVFWGNASTNGTFTSPNFPGLYPRNTECHYLFYGAENECIHITFPYFDVEGISPGCFEATQSDYVEFSNFNVELTDRKMSRFCGSKQEQAKRTVSSDGNFFRVTFKSNEVYDATGFEAFYQFRKIEDPDSAKVRSSSPSLLEGATGLCVYATVAILLSSSFTTSC